jgi:hypothetical protein
MKLFNYIIIIILFGIVNVHIVNADSLKLYLYNAEDNIRFDKFSSEKVNVDTQLNTNRTFDKEENIVRGTYEIELISSNTNVPPILLTIEPQLGTFNVMVPYYEHIIKVNILKNGTVVDTADLNKYSTCNSNLVCEYEKGEDNNTCISDCLGSDITFSEETQKTLQKENGIIRDEAGVVLLSTNTLTPDTNTTAEPEQSKTLGNITILIGGILFLVAGVGVFIWKLRKR